jgi:hypothetical protein
MPRAEVSAVHVPGGCRVQRHSLFYPDRDPPTLVRPPLVCKTSGGRHDRALRGRYGTTRGAVTPAWGGVRAGLLLPRAAVRSAAESCQARGAILSPCVTQALRHGHRGDVGELLELELLVFQLLRLALQFGDRRHNTGAERVAEDRGV